MTVSISSLYATVAAEATALQPAGYIGTGGVVETAQVLGEAVEPEVPVTYSFAAGMPAREWYPFEDLKEYAARAIDHHATAALEYFGGETGGDEMMYGYKGLRDLLVQRHLESDGRDLVREGVILTSGAAQGMALAVNAFLGPGDGAVVEASTYPFITGYMLRTGAKVLTAPIDDDGMDIDALARRFDEFEAEGLRPKMVYTIPTFQIPTATVMSLDRRRRLVELAQERSVMVLEDNVYYWLRYDGAHVPTLFSLDDSGLVMSLNSFSKVIAPGLRLGWVAGVPEAISPLAAVRQDLGVSQWISRMVGDYVADGKLDAHIKEVLGPYRHKRDIALAALRKYCEPWVSFRVPEGGIYFWLQLDERVDGIRVRQELAREGISAGGGERYAGDDSGRQFLRLSFLLVPDDEIERGIAALGKAISASIEET